MGPTGSYQQQWSLILATVSDLGITLPQQPSAQLPQQHAGLGAGQGQCAGSRGHSSWGMAEKITDNCASSPQREREGEEDDKDAAVDSASRLGAALREGSGGVEGAVMVMGPAPPPSCEPGRWCCIYKDAAQVDAYEGSDLQLEVIGRKISGKEWKVLEAAIDTYVAHAQAVTIQRRALTFLGSRMLRRKRCSARVLQVTEVERNSVGKYRENEH